MSAQPSAAELNQLPILLQAIDEDLVALESQRDNQELLDQLTTTLQDFSQITNARLNHASHLTSEVTHYLEAVQSGATVLSSSAFEQLFNAVTLMQEQVEWSLENGGETENSQLPKMLERLQEIAQPIPMPPPLEEPTAVSASSQPAASNPTEPSVPPAKSASSRGSDLPISRTTLDHISGSSSRLLNMMQELEAITYAGDVEAIREHLKDCIGVCESVNGVLNPSTEEKSVTFQSVVEEMEVMIRQWAETSGKQVKLVPNAGDLAVPGPLLEVLRRALFQFTQYLIEESLESPSNRGTKGPEGHIYLEALEESKHLLFTISDDGKGFRKESLKQRATEHGILKPGQINSMADQDIWGLIFEEGMFSADDAEVGAQFPQLKRDIEALEGTVGLEAQAEAMASFIMAFPAEMENASFISTMSSMQIPSDLPQNISADLESLQTSAEAIQSIMDGLHTQVASKEIRSMEMHLHRIFSALTTLIDGLSHGDISSARQATLTLSQMANVDLFKEVGMMAREMHENLKSFSHMMDAQFQDFDMEQIPDAAQRLEHIIQMTENSANTTLDLSESLMVDSGDSQADLTSLGELLTATKEKSKTPEVEECLQIIEMMQSREQQVSEKIVNIMTAQDYQDRTGQVIKKIIVLVNDLEKRLVSLVKTFGSAMLPEEESVAADTSSDTPAQPIETEASKAEEKEVEMYGPQHDQGKGMTNQDDVDSLLAQFGF